MGRGHGENTGIGAEWADRHRFRSPGGGLLGQTRPGIDAPQHRFGLEYAAEITRDGAGQSMLHHRMALPAYPHAPHARMPSLLSNAIFSPGTKDKRVELAEAGLDEFFLEAVTQGLAPMVRRC